MLHKCELKIISIWIIIVCPRWTSFNTRQIQSLLPRMTRLRKSTDISRWLCWSWYWRWLGAVPASASRTHLTISKWQRFHSGTNSSLLIARAIVLVDHPCVELRSSLASNVWIANANQTSVRNECFIVLHHIVSKFVYRFIKIKSCTNICPSMLKCSIASSFIDSKFNNCWAS